MSGLSISSNNIQKCSDVADQLLTVGIQCKVIENTSIVLNHKTNQYVKERGCDILITDPVVTQKKIKAIWMPIRERYNLECAYLNILGNYQGCIWDYMRDSNCPRG